ncbi:MAG: multicopper oxidase family protein [Deltaproteobacteria bacterium]|jgi:FtsP/CotA-like multicopper oxidase with cupredoxin domain|nr:multicopper oxidase family protein [Deltaproteobacteria bacterium]
MNLSRMAVITLILGLLFPTSAYAEQPLHLEAKESYHQFPFFDTPTPVWSYDDQIPGPLIRGRVGTTMVIDFANRLKEPSSIHWHGLRIENAMDGVPGVTQEPVGPGKNFTYRLKLEDAGTFWYHPHFNSSEQLERGLKGVFIVEEAAKPPWSQDWVWLMDDWLLQKDGTIYSQFNTGRDLMHDGRWGNVPTINARFRPEFQVKPGERIRLRLINGANARIFSPHIEGLAASVIAVDGRPVTEIFPLERFVLSPGNRIDLDVRIPPQAGGSIFAVEDRFTRNAFPLATIKVAPSTPIDTPEVTPPTAADFIPAQMFAEVKVGKTWDLDAIRGGRFGIGWTMNRKLWPDADKAAYRLGEPQKVTFKNSSSRLHPMHIHGVFFRVLERNGKKAAEPFTRDTVLVGPRESVTIGFVPEHPGIWLTHCHIQEHAEAGMMTTIDVKHN